MKRAQGYPTPLGVSKREKSVNFAVEAVQGEVCELLLYKQNGCTPFKSYEMPEKDGIGMVRFLELSDWDEQIVSYQYKMGEKLVVDPYARAVAGKGSFGAQPGEELLGVVGAESYEWEGDRPLQLPYSEIVAYSLHVRGFTKHSSSGVKHKGTFLGVVEKISYLKELGINQIHCMPVYEFEDYQKNYVNYWGYGPAYYFAPKASYSATGDPVRELKDMIKACHSEGIEVILDLPFDQGTHGQMVEACLQHYVIEYHVDGFILNPYNVPMESIRQNPLLKRTKIMTKDDGFQNAMRRFLKSDEGTVMGAVWALRHNTKDDGNFNYVTTHTGFTLEDLVSYDGKHNELNGEKNQDGPDYNYSWNCGAEGATRRKGILELRRNQVKNAFFLLLMAQGTPCILAGDEFSNTQKGNNNVYCQDNPTAWLNWSRQKRNPELFQYVKALIALRKEHPVLHRESALLGLDTISCGIPDVSYHGENAWQIPSEISSRQLGILY